MSKSIQSERYVSGQETEETGLGINNTTVSFVHKVKISQ